MDVEVNKENVCINKFVCEKKELIFVEEDIIVPDSKPDVLNVVNLTGNVCMYKKEVMEGKIKLEGSLDTYLMYIPDSQTDNLRGLNANISFSQIINILEAKDNMNEVTDVLVKSLECKILNGRKINVRAGLEVNVRLYATEDLAIINGVNNIDKLQTLKEDFNINSLVGSGTTRIYVKDTLNMIENDEMLEILKADVSLDDTDIKVSYNKILSKCEAEIKIMYLTQDNRINNIEGKIPAVGFIDMPNVTEEDSFDIKNEIKNIIIKPNSGEEHSIYVEVEIESLCMCYEKKEISVLQDVYSPLVNLDVTHKKVTTMSEKITRSKTFTLNSKINISDLVDGNLLDVEIDSIINKEQKSVSNVLYEGELGLNFIFNSGDSSNISSKASKIPFDFTIENPILKEEVNTDITSLVSNKNFVVKPNGDVECNIDMDFVVEFYENLDFNVIESIEANEIINDSNEDYNSLIIYIVQPGDSLWNIAKKFRSTVDEIAITNGIENKDKIDVGQKLYIPKFNYTLKVS